LSAEAPLSGLILAVVGAALFALLLVAGIFGRLVAVLRSGGQIEVFKQPARNLSHRPPGRRSSAPAASSSTPAFSSIHGAIRSSPDRAASGGASPVRRSRASSAIAVARGTFVGTPGAQDGIAPNPSVDQFRKIASYAVHRPRAERLDASAFEGIKHGPRVGIERCSVRCCLSS
jgi:hypothetical protein